MTTPTVITTTTARPACHTLEFVVSGNGEIAIEGLYVFEPPLK
jgi:hypothetical protein